MAPVFQGCGAIAKMTEVWLRSFYLHKHGSSSGALGFHECGSGALFYLHSSPASGRFHTL